MTITVGFKRLSEHAKLPTKANPTDSGYDLYAAHDAYIYPGQTVVVKTDLAVILPEGFEAQVRPRSGITSRTKLRVQLGTIDQDYRGNIGIIIDNICEGRSPDPKMVKIGETSGNPFQVYEINRGDKLAQLVIQAIPKTEIVEITEELESSSRGEGGFGSSGMR